MRGCRHTVDDALWMALQTLMVLMGALMDAVVETLEWADAWRALIE